MTAHSTAQGIASLGRYGDDLIVHMNQEEVQGLQALAKQHGTSLTINPKTGMPEAFKLGKVFKAVLPIAAGFALGPGGFGLGESIFGAGSFMSSALGTGLLIGGATAALTGNLGQGLMAGLGAYGGYGLSDTLSKLGTAGASNATSVANATQAATGAPLVGASSQFISPFTPQGIAGGAGLGVGTVGGGAANAITNQALNAGLTGANTVANAGNIANTANVAAPVSGFEKSYKGLKSLFEPGGFEQAKTTLGTTIPGKEEAITGVTKDAYGNVISTTSTPATAATVKPISTGQLAMKLGSAPAGALLQGVGPEDFYEQPITPQEKQVYEQTGVDAMGRPTYGYIAASAFNPYRNQNLGGVGPLKLVAKGGAIESYATGGTIQSGGIRDLYGTPDNQPTISPGLSGFGLGRLNNLAGEQALDKAKTLGYADGGDVNINLSKLPSLNVNEPSTTGSNTFSDSQLIATMQALMPFKGMKGNFNISRDSAQGQLPTTNDDILKKVMPVMSTGPIYYAGMNEPKFGMAKGGYLDGAGDGMSDSIPATIEGKQPARLADGEFVVPADVVSHLGNGSSKAGSKKLYAMLDKVRKARTGRVKQGKQINADRYLPKVA